MNHKVWKTIESLKHENMFECVKLLEKEKYIVSHWIKDISKTKSDISKIKFPLELYRIKLSDLGLIKPTILEDVYKALDHHGFEPIDPLIVINTRFIYDEQSTGEWLRIAVPFGLNDR